MTRLTVTTLLALIGLMGITQAQVAGAARGPGRANIETPPAAGPRSASDALAAHPQAPTLTRSQSPEAAAGTPRDHRLPPRSTEKDKSRDNARPAASLIDDLKVEGKHVTTVLAALALVVGLMLSSLWVLKKAAPKSAKLAPTAVARVLGRISLASKQQAQLLHIGNKIILVSATAAGVESLGEIDDPNEVQRILAACDRQDGRGTQASFDDVFRSFGTEKVRGFLGDEARR